MKGWALPDNGRAEGIVSACLEHLLSVSSFILTSVREWGLQVWGSLRVKTLSFLLVRRKCQKK